jgi:GNAT superfamily N-acetyltransferase
MNDSVICRAALKSDLSQILDLYPQPGLDDGARLSLPEAEHLFDRTGQYPDYHLHVAVRGEKIIGTFAMLIMDNLGHLGAPSAVIEDVAVDPEYQGQGVGKVMMTYAFRICKEKGCYKASLSSNMKRNKAHAFYESLGFERHGYSFRIDVDIK